MNVFVSGGAGYIGSVCVEVHFAAKTLVGESMENPHKYFHNNVYGALNLLHVQDLAQAHILALSAADSGYFNLGTGGGVSVSEVIEACRQVTGHKIPIVQKPRRPGDPPRLVAASAKAKKQLRWTPKYEDIHEIVKSAWAWHAKHPKGDTD